MAPSVAVSIPRSPRPRELLVRTAEAAFGEMTAVNADDLPQPGDVVIRALAYEGPRAASAPEDDESSRGT